MAEVTRRSFDLKSWQGLTEVLKSAREGGLAPSAYANFRNLVLEYAQQKGTDAELKKKIDAIIATFGEKEKEISVVPKEMTEEKDPERLGRRIVPTFAPRPSIASTSADATAMPAAALGSESLAPQKPVDLPLPVPQVESTPSAVPTPEPTILSTSEPTIQVPPPVLSEEVPPPHAGVKSVEEHRARIMEIKRTVNTQIKNPIALVDHGNPVGREYMGALLAALKATNPGATYNLEGAMETLEDVYARVLERASYGDEVLSSNGDVPPVVKVSPTQPTQPAPSVSTPVPEVASPTPSPLPLSTPVPPPEPIPLPVVKPAPEPRREPVHEPMHEPVHEAVHEPVIEVPILEEAPIPVPLQEEHIHKPIHANKDDVSSVSDSHSNQGGDTDFQNQIQELRKKLSTIAVPTSEMSGAGTAPAEDHPVAQASDADLDDQIKELRKQLGTIVVPDIPTQGTLAPTVGDTEIGMLPQVDPHGTVWDPYAKEVSDALGPTSHSLDQDSSLSSITLDTPQAELVSPEVTMALTELLHEWKIFASSGIFGMGPGGIEHPLYIKISRLPMGEVLAGRFESADMKVVHAIKDYVDAWRHEQAVAYNPSETFEHYLRRVSQRIMKRQRGRA